MFTRPQVPAWSSDFDRLGRRRARAGRDIVDQLAALTPGQRAGIAVQPTPERGPLLRLLFIALGAGGGRRMATGGTRPPSTAYM
jgi:hypothetical protein